MNKHMCRGFRPALVPMLTSTPQMNFSRSIGMLSGHPPTTFLPVPLSGQALVWTQVLQAIIRRFQRACNGPLFTDQINQTLIFRY